MKTAFELALDSQRNTMIKFATKLTRCEHKAKDLFQESAIKAFQNQDKLDDLEKFKSWFSTILYNTFINGYRKQARRRELLNNVNGQLPHFFNRSKDYNAGFENLKLQDVRELSKQVGPNSYKAFNLYTEGHSYKEISQDLDIAIGTVKSRIHFARNRMKKLTQQHNIAQYRQ